MRAITLCAKRGGPLRRLYLLSDHEFAEDFEGMGLDPESDSIDPPACPLCGRELLAAYQEEGEMYILYEDALQEGEALGAEAWHLVCGNFECPYEEQVERVFRPAGALLYDLRTAIWDFGEATGFFHSEPRVLRELLEHMQACQANRPQRKLLAHVAELQFQYEYALKERRDWLARLPRGQQVEFTTAEGRVEGTLLGAEPDAILVGAGAGTVRVALERIQFFSPRYPEPESPGALPPDHPGFKHLVLVTDNERIVVRGHHLVVEEVDRFGRFHVSTRDPLAGVELPMKHLGHRYAGVFLPRDVEERYEIHRMVQVRCHWLEVTGPTTDDQVLAVRSHDPVAAAALALRLYRSPRPGLAATGWHGFVTRNQVQAEEAHYLHIWPIPEVSRDRADK